MEELESGQVELTDGYSLHYEIRDKGSNLIFSVGIVGGDGIVAVLAFEKKE